jgi:hypothetical protein
MDRARSLILNSKHNKQIVITYYMIIFIGKIIKNRNIRVKKVIIRGYEDQNK